MLEGGCEEEIVFLYLLLSLFYNVRSIFYASSGTARICGWPWFLKCCCRVPSVMHCEMYFYVCLLRLKCEIMYLPSGVL
jgi:hypothetical protein